MTLGDFVRNFTFQTIQTRTIDQTTNSFHEAVVALFFFVHVNRASRLLKRLAFRQCVQQYATELIDAHAFGNSFISKVALVVFYGKSSNFLRVFGELAFGSFSSFQANFIMIYFSHFNILFDFCRFDKISIAPNTHTVIGWHRNNTGFVWNPRIDRNRPVTASLFHIADNITDRHIASDAILDIIVNFSCQCAFSKTHNRTQFSICTVKIGFFDNANLLSHVVVKQKRC